MKYSNFNSLKNFYDSASGEEAATRISEYLKSRLTKKKALLIGYGKPFLEKMSDEKLFYAIPYGYEINRWPEIRPFRTVVIDETELPFVSESFDVVVILNFLEYCKNAESFLDEISRILNKEGNLKIISFNKFIFSNKHSRIRHSIKRLLSLADARGFYLQEIYCINKNLHLFHHLKAFRYLLLKTFPFFYDIIILDEIKKTAASEAVINFQEKYKFS